VPLTTRGGSFSMRRNADDWRRVSQLGLVALVYPGACHSHWAIRWRISNACCISSQLATDERFAGVVRPDDGRDIHLRRRYCTTGTLPFCHAIEDMALPGVPTHELFQ